MRIINVATTGYATEIWFFCNAEWLPPNTHTCIFFYVCEDVS